MLQILGSYIVFPFNMVQIYRKKKNSIIIILIYFVRAIRIAFINVSIFYT